MTKDERVEILTEIINDLTDTKRVCYLVAYFQQFSNDYVAYLSGYGNEETFDKCTKP